MKRIFLYFILICLLIASFLLGACSQSNQTTSSNTSTQPISQTVNPSSTTPTSAPAKPANWWDKFGTPQYGGTLNVRADPTATMGAFDPNAMQGGGPWLEYLEFLDWKVDRTTWAFIDQWLPLEYTEGLLAESWQVTGPTTLTVKIRQGVKFQNKTPVNGRAMTADDIVYSYDRVLGTGNGFNQSSAMFFQQAALLKGVKATDKYTVELEFTAPIGPLSISGGMGDSVFEVPILPHEWGDLAPPQTAAPAGGPPGAPPGPGAAPATAAVPISDWKNVVGTGPWILTDFIVGNKMTFAKNADYWGYDERYPQNKLPYVDQMNYIAIGDNATAMAAARTGKIDMLINPLMTQSDGDNLAKTNPDIQISWFHNPSAAVMFRCDKTPFTDIKVRKAMQMAVDVPSIGKNYFSGHSDSKPVGLVSPALTGWAKPFDEWPADLQQEYTYSPEKAKQLLADAGYPNGFATSVVAINGQDLQLLQVIKAYFKDIGVDMEIQPMDGSAAMGYLMAGKQEQLVYFDTWAGMGMSPGNSLSSRLSTSIPFKNWTFNNDKTFDDMFNKVITAGTIDEAKPYSVQADLYAASQHWAVHLCRYEKPFCWQKWIKGFSGESTQILASGILARTWIDQTLKK